MDYVKAFIIGGLICALVQILLDKTKLMPVRLYLFLVLEILFGRASRKVWVRTDFWGFLKAD